MTLVVLLFLQNWRSVIIPLVAVPVSLIGTFAIMALLGFSLNNISLLGLVLAIGVVVDDAIVVVENVERWIEHGLSPREAAYKSMEEVTVAVIAIAFGLSAVFIPTAFIPGISGQFYRQFALTIATSTLISAFNSLTLSPALAAILLKPHAAQKDWLSALLDLTLGWLFRGFNRAFNATTAVYARLVRLCIRGAIVALLVYGGLLWLTYVGFTNVPTGFVPEPGQGLPALSPRNCPTRPSLERTRAVLRQMEDIALSKEMQDRGVGHTVGIAGQSFLLNANGSNFASLFVVLKPFHDRHEADQSADAVASGAPQGVHGEDRRRPGGGLRRTACRRRGQCRRLQAYGQGSRATRGWRTCRTRLTPWRRLPISSPDWWACSACSGPNTPQLFVDVDRQKCKRLGVPLNDVFGALQTFLGGYYVNDFNEFGRTWQVNLQARADFRDQAAKVRRIEVRNSRGDMVPLGTLATVRDSTGPMMITRYNGVTAAALNGAWMPGTSSGQAVEKMDKLAAEKLDPTMSTEWTELTLQEILAGNTALLIFPLCILFVFLTHAAEYESWALPVAIILIVPMSLLCALAGVWLRGMDNNIFTQIGFVILAGLACKNAVLIVEFAKQEHEHGKDRFDAAVEASRLRLRPIMMTSFAFILGVVPLMLSTGAGAEMRQTLGTGVFAGMLGVTFFGIFLTPVFYVVLQRLSERT